MVYANGKCYLQHVISNMLFSFLFTYLFSFAKIKSFQCFLRFVWQSRQPEGIGKLSKILRILKYE
jgi:hypothetical protein